MARTLVHRGPDDEGVWVDPGGAVALGFRRLSILDLTPEGHQPMASADGRYTVAFNGEIYNFAALRSELVALGHQFRGGSDTEVLLAAVVQWGFERTLPRLWGMFAIALWDSRERLLHLGRDRLGKKPLYLGWQGDVFLFGSELKALRAHPAFAAPVDRDALASYLRFSYVPSPQSIYRGIAKLPAASWVTIHPDQLGQVSPWRRYWDPEAMARSGDAAPISLGDSDATDSLDRLLRDAVRLRAVADVPIGAFLSGGIDSSTVVAILQAETSRRVQTFTIGYAQKEYDESAHAREVARHLGTDHTALVVTPEQARAVIPFLPTIYDEPFADVSQIPTFLVSQLARSRVTVALSGDGGDESFAGYTRYVAGTRLWQRLERVPAPVRKAIASALGAATPAGWSHAGSVLDSLLPRRLKGQLTGNRIQKLATVLGSADFRGLYLSLVSTWLHPETVALGGTEAAGPLPSWSASKDLRSPAHRMMLLDTLGYLPDDVLVKVDRASMAAGLEARAPLLDHRVVEFAWSLPIGQKIRGREGKWLLRQVLERYVPRALFERPKQGFGVPIDAWLRGPLREWAEDLLSEDRLEREGYLAPAPIRSAWREHLAGSANRQQQLWAVLMFQSWLTTYGGGGGSPAPGLAV
jgi:asparagine synthase (glutamine-hydrolysing)